MTTQTVAPEQPPTLGHDRQSGWRRRGTALERRYFELCEHVGYEIDPHAIVETLPMGKRQMVAILQALAEGADLVIMDEPTASLSPSEREQVFDVVRRLAARHQRRPADPDPSRDRRRALGPRGDPGRRDGG